MRQTEFILWYHEVFQASELYRAMCETIEDSPYHRERNVGVHTDMVVSSYLQRVPTIGEWGPAELRGAFACAFHDVGKPSSEEEKWSEERGHYRRYGGHESVSARMWEDHVCSNWAFFDAVFGMKAFDVYAVAWMIEHHLPYSTKKADKLDHLYQTAQMVGDGGPVFMDVLLADTFGRISDDAEAKRNATIDYASAFELERFKRPLPEARASWQSFEKVVVLPIGASGVGKSTWYDDFTAGWEGAHGGSFAGRKNAWDPHPVKFSWDDLRLEWYDSEDYSRAYELQVADKDFDKKAQARFVEDLARSPVVVVDNTNLSRKRRAFFVNTARQKGYKVVGVTFPIALDVLKERQASRTDKTIPMGAVVSHYNATQMPFYGEFDDVVVCGQNLR